MPLPPPLRSTRRFLCLAAAVGYVVAGCSASPPPETTTPTPPPAPLPEAVEPEDTVLTMVEEDTLLAPAPDTVPRLERLLRAMSLEEKIGQMMMPFVLGDFAPKGSASHERMARLVTEQKVGGFVVSVGAPMDVAAKLNDLQGHADIPLLFAADFETGAGFRLSGAVHLPTNIPLGGATVFPSLMAVGATGDPGLAYEMGRVTAIEARAVGVHVAFAPVLDVNSNPDNPIINTRSFGEDPARVSEMGVAFVRGLEEHGVVATGKHFPGHGDTDVDSHLGLPVIEADRSRLDTLELRPFQAAIDIGMRGVMTAHITVPALNGGGGDPATLSRPVMTELLRDQMGFEGLLFTDAMDMGAIDRGFGRQEAVVLAIEAGADVILMPPSVEGAIAGVMEAVQSGRLPEDRIDASVAKILQAKEDLRIFDEPAVPLDRVPALVGIPEHQEAAENVARRSITLLRNERDLLPLLGTRSARVLSVTYRRTNDLLAGRYFNGVMGSVYPRLTTVDVDRDAGAADYGAILAQAARSQLVVVSLYVTFVSYSGSVGVPEEAVEFIQALAERDIPHVVISFGNPYLLADFPDAQAYMLAWSGSQVSQRAAAQALFGEFALTGRTPTRLPPFFAIGDGLQLPPKDAGGG